MSIELRFGTVAAVNAGKVTAELLYDNATIRADAHSNTNSIKTMFVYFKFIEVELFSIIYS